MYDVKASEGRVAELGGMTIPGFGRVKSMIGAWAWTPVEHLEIPWWERQSGIVSGALVPACWGKPRETECEICAAARAAFAEWIESLPVVPEHQAGVRRNGGGQIHELKTIQPFFGEVASGAKTAELRVDDRTFSVGDQLVLREFTGSEYPGGEIAVVVTHVLRGFRGLAPGWVMLSFKKLEVGK